MSNFCPDCAKFTSTELDEQPDVSDESVDVDTEAREAMLTCTVVVKTTCGECSADRAEGSFDFERTLDLSAYYPDPDAEDADAQANADVTDAPEGCAHDWQLDVEASAFDDYRPKTKTLKSGIVKPVPFRYQKHYYGAEVQFRLSCNLCGAEETMDAQDDMAASYMDELT